jgi:hypothetical protein
MDYLFARIGSPYLATTLQPKGSRFDPFFKFSFSSMNKMDEKKQLLGNFFTLDAPKKKGFCPKKRDKMVTPTMFLKEQLSCGEKD